LLTALRNDSFLKRPLGICQLSALVDAASYAHHSGVFTVSQGKHITGNVVAFTLGPTSDVQQNGLSRALPVGIFCSLKFRVDFEGQAMTVN
jgi:uncharacterized membrane protein YoaK (UPF0700 family)